MTITAPTTDTSKQPHSATASSDKSEKSPQDITTTSPPAIPVFPIHYFFYGTLQIPSLLQSLLQLPAAPSLHPARITGFTSKLWGPYPALVEGSPDDVVRGMVYEVQTQEHAERLARYETKAYEAVGCRIFVKEREEEAKDGVDDETKEEEEEVDGMVFKCRGDGEDLEDGVFDLQEWTRRTS